MDDNPTGTPQDVLIGDRSTLASNPSTFELANEQALLDSLTEWNSPASRPSRELALDGLIQSIVDDLDEDKLTGSSDDDWFLVGLGDIITDGNGGNGNGGGKGNGP